MSEAVNDVFRALADPSRRALLDALFKRNGQTLGELCEGMAMTRQAVTKHLALLEDANLVAIVWRGREKLHYLNPVPLHQIYERWIGKFEKERRDTYTSEKAIGDFEICCAGLQPLLRTKNINKCIGTNYHLKHLLERWPGSSLVLAG